MKTVDDIDWSVFEPGDEMTCSCRCEAVYRSFAKSVNLGRWCLATQKPCPKCGSHVNCYSGRSDPEAMTL